MQWREEVGGEVGEARGCCLGGIWARGRGVGCRDGVGLGVPGALALDAGGRGEVAPLVLEVDVAAGGGGAVMSGVVRWGGGVSDEGPGMSGGERMRKRERKRERTGGVSIRSGGSIDSNMGWSWP